MLDYSSKALDRAARLFEGLKIPAEFVEADALALGEDLKWLPRRQPEKVADNRSFSQGQSPSRKFSRRLPRVQKGTPWDEHISYALVLWTVKPHELQRKQYYE